MPIHSASSVGSAQGKPGGNLWMHQAFGIASALRIWVKASGEKVYERIPPLERGGAGPAGQPYLT